MLAVYILKYIATMQAMGGESVKLSNLMVANNIPRSTFYRAVNDLLDANVIERVSVGQYSLTMTFAHLVNNVVLLSNREVG